MKLHLLPQADSDVARVDHSVLGFPARHSDGQNAIISLGILVLRFFLWFHVGHCAIKIMVMASFGRLTGGLGFILLNLSLLKFLVEALLDVDVELWTKLHSAHRCASLRFDVFTISFAMIIFVFFIRFTEGAFFAMLTFSLFNLLSSF
jgi:hypothetical protein